MSSSLIRYVAGQLAYTVAVIAVASFLVFLALRVTPGDPINSVLNPIALNEARQSTRRELGLDQPLAYQYLNYVGRMLHGRFGVSLLNGKDIATMVLEYGLRTSVLAGSALLLTYLLALPLGVLAAVKRNSIWDQLASFFANLCMAVPNFWLALLLILLFSFHLHWLPVGGKRTFSHLILPMIVLSAEGIAVNTRLMRTSMLEQLNQEYIRMLRAKGLNTYRIICVHAARNALPPVVSLAGLRFGWLLGYTLIVETIFRWFGLGFLLVDSVMRRDYPVAQVLSLILTVTVLLGNFFANVLHAWLDPRVRESQA